MVGDGRPVHERYARALARDADLELVLSVPQIVGGGAFQHNADIRLHLEARGKRAAQPDLLLRGERERQLAVIGRIQKPQHGIHAHAVVQRLGAHKAVAKGRIG